jgi:hypothetical protein
MTVLGLFQAPPSSPDKSEAPVKLFPRKRESSTETDPEPPRAFDGPNEIPDDLREAPDDFDDDAFARAIAEGRARDPESYGGQKIA